MTKVNNNKILSTVVFSLLILLILAVGTIAFLPMFAKADGYYGGTSTYSQTTVYPYSYTDTSTNYNVNPVPYVSYVDPSSTIPKYGSIQMLVRGSNFIPSSRVRFDNITLPTIYKSSIMINAVLDASLLSTPGTHVITVVNPGPGGGTSNGQYFTVKTNTVVYNTNTTVVGTSNYNYNNAVYPMTTAPIYNGSTLNPDGQQIENLSANVLYGQGSFVPGSLVGWIFLAIVVLLIVIVVRKVFGLDRKYHSEPLKHS